MQWADATSLPMPFLNQLGIAVTLIMCRSPLLNRWGWSIEVHITNMQAPYAT